MSSTPPLNYAPPPPLHQRRLFWRTILILTLIAFICSSWWWAPPIWLRVQLVYWQHQCLMYAPPANQVVFATSVDKITKSVVPTEWSKFYTLLSPPGFRSDGTILLHDMTKRNGEHRLVAIDTFFNGDFIGAYEAGYCRVFIPGSLFRLPHEQSHQEMGRRMMYYYSQSPRIYPAIVDPTDSNHFTLGVDTNDQRLIFDGWLEDDDTIAISQRSCTAK
jgi:hypothetical protein